MSSNTDNHDEGSELQAVMGAYFDALLQESAAVLQDVMRPVVAEACVDPELALPAMTTQSQAMPQDELHITVGDRPVTSSADYLPAAASAPCSPVAVTMVDRNLNCAGAQATAVPSYQMIQVGGLTLGVPAEAIADITALPVSTVPEAVAPTWLLGTAALSQGPVNIVDTAALLMPNTGHRIRTNGGYIVLLRGERWALACDSIGDVLTPDPSQVHWRGAEGKRLWLAGTIRTPSGALLDIPQLINLLSA